MSEIKDEKEKLGLYGRGWMNLAEERYRTIAEIGALAFPHLCPTCHGKRTGQMGPKTHRDYFVCDTCNGTGRNPDHPLLPDEVAVLEGNER